MSDASFNFVNAFLGSKAKEQDAKAQTEQLEILVRPEIARLAADLSEKASQDVQDLVHKAQNKSLTDKQQEILTATADYRRESAKRIEQYMIGMRK